MNPEDRIRNAFADLETQVRSEIDPRTRLAELTQPRSRSLVLALAAAAAVVVLIGGVAALNLLPANNDVPPVISQPDTPSTSTTPQTDSTVSPPETATSGGSPTPTGPSTPDTTEPPVASDAPTAPLYRVDTEMVLADTEDPVLNVRVEPDPSAEIVRSLAPTYAGVRPTGATAVLDSGAVWWEVDLIHPVSLNDVGLVLSGYVNSAYLIPLPEGLPVTVDELPACTSEPTSIPEVGGTDNSPPEFITSVDFAEVADGCTRYVVTFGSEVGPADSALSYQTITDQPLTVGLGRVDSVTAGSGGLHVVQEFDGSFSITIPGASSVQRITTVPGRGLLVIDVPTSQVNTDPVLIVDEPFGGGDSVTFTGIARPFEATMFVSVEDENGTPVEATFAGTIAGTIRGTGTGVMTTNWISAWGRFAFEISGLPAGSYQLAIVTSAEDNPPATRIPFTIETDGSTAVPSEGANQLGLDFGSLAYDPSSNQLVPFADTVTIGLVQGDTGTVDSARLTDRASWVLDVDGYRGRAGTADVLSEARRPLRITEGEIPHCASPPAPIPAQFDGMQRINLEPINATSCLEWFSITLFHDGAQVHGVLYDLYEP